jgi:long-subunit fatty acid transport protein
LSNANPDSNFTVIYRGYSLRTPAKFSGSLAYVFNKSGFLSFDYAVKDHSNIKYGIQNDFRNPNINNQVLNLLTVANSFRVGGEYKIKQFSVRGGYGYEESPYKNKKTIGATNSFSSGLGYAFETVKVDLSYTLTRRNSQNTLLNVGLPDFSALQSRIDNMALTLIFNL